MNYYYQKQTFLDLDLQRMLVHLVCNDSQWFQIHSLKMMAHTSVNIKYILVNSRTRAILSSGGISLKNE